MQDLAVIVNESGLDKTKAQVLLDNFSDYFKIAAEWEQKAKTIKVVDETQKADMEMARVGRLFLREKRIAIEKKRKELKEQSLREGKAIDGIANVLKAVIVPIEEYLDQQEKFVKIQEEKKREALRLELEKKAEEERLENERLDKLAQDRYNMAIQYKDFWSTGKYIFREMSQTNFESVMEQLRNKKTDYDKEQERIRKENEKLQKEAEAKERALQEERRKVEAEKQEAERKAKAEQERLKKEAEAKQRTLEEKARKDREEAKAKQKAIEDKAKKEKEAIEKKAKAEREKAEAEKKAAEERECKQKEEAERKQKETEAKAKKEQDRIKKEADKKAEVERKKREELEKKLKNQVECPKCHYKFQIK